MVETQTRANLVPTETENRSSIAELLVLLHERQTFLVTSHARPDGDAIGSALGLAHLLRELGKEVTVAFADPIPAVYRWLPGAEQIQSALPAAAPDAGILLECSGIERSGFAVVDFEAMGSGMTFNIDHHLSGRAFADFNWIDSNAAAVGAMIYDLAVASGVEITPAIATCLYVAVLTDTGAFTYPCTVAATFALAEHLVRRGADASGIARQVYHSNPPAKIRALAAALGHMQLEGHVAWSWILQSEMELAGAEVEDCEGIVSYLIGMAGVEAAVFLRELPAGAEFRLSLRSKGRLDVARIAEQFGGGGHRNASGCTVEGPLSSAAGRVVAALQLA